MNKASGGDEILAELFQILKNDAMNVLHSICQQFGNSAVATGLENVSFHSNPKERQCQRMLKLPHNCTHLIHWHPTPLLLPGKSHGWRSLVGYSPWGR